MRLQFAAGMIVAYRARDLDAAAVESLCFVDPPHFFQRLPAVKIGCRVIRIVFQQLA